MKTSNRGRIGSGGLGEAETSRMDLPLQASLVVRLRGVVMLEYDGKDYGDQDLLPAALLKASPFVAGNGRQFVAHCMLMQAGSDAGKWPLLARIFTGID